MATEYTLNGLYLAPVPTEGQTVDAYYKVWNATNFTLIADDLAVNTDGTLVSPPTITGLTPGQVYNIQFIMPCSSPMGIFNFTITVPS